MAERLDHAERNGVTGGVFRTDWERINDWWSLETINETNLIAAARMSNGRPADTGTVCKEWLVDHGFSAEAAPWLASILDLTWPNGRRALHLADSLLDDSLLLPRRVAKPWTTVGPKPNLYDRDHFPAAEPTN